MGFRQFGLDAIGAHSSRKSNSAGNERSSQLSSYSVCAAHKKSLFDDVFLYLMRDRAQTIDQWHCISLPPCFYRLFCYLVPITITQLIAIIAKLIWKSGRFSKGKIRQLGRNEQVFDYQRSVTHNFLVWLLPNFIKNSIYKMRFFTQMGHFWNCKWRSAPRDLLQLYSWPQLNLEP
jgi:hypothetical protein